MHVHLSKCCNKILHEIFTTTPQPFYNNFSGPTRLSWCQKKASSRLYGAREDNRGRHTNNTGGCHSIWTIKSSVIHYTLQLLHTISLMLCYASQVNLDRRRTVM